MRESARYILQILVFVALILSLGTGGYMIIEDGMTAADAFYTTVTAITPAQFEEVHELSVPGRYFTVVLVFCGFGAVVAFATQFARLVIQSELEGVGVITRKQMRRRISRMKNHYIVCGYGEIGSAICSELRSQQQPFVVITSDKASLAAIDSEGYPRVQGNPTADQSLREAEIERADGVIVVLPDDSDNLFISLAARELNPSIFIIARGEEASVEDRILRAGADIVVSPTKLGGQQIAALVRQQSVLPSSTPSPLPQLQTMGVSLQVYQHAGETTKLDAVLAAPNLVGAASVLGVAGIQRSNGSFEATPPEESDVQSGDELVLIIRDTSVDDAAARKPGRVHHEPSGRVILLADDHRALRLLFARKLAAAGHEVIQAADGEETITLARKYSPDLIVLDVNMPGRDGYDVCGVLRNEPFTAECPIILYSGDSTEEFVQRGQAAGADRCLRKSSKSSELLASIDELFAERDQAASATASEPAAEQHVAATEETDRPAIDWQIALESVDDNRELLQEVSVAMLEETPRLMQRLEQAVRQRDADELDRAAHTLAGSLTTLGGIPAAEQASTLERLSPPLDWHQVERRRQTLVTRVESFLEALQNAPREATIAAR